MTTKNVNRKTSKKAVKISQRSIDYQAMLIESLKDREHAAAYLNAAIEESLKSDKESQQLFLIALRNVAEAQGSMQDLAKRAKVRRESLYRMLSKKGNPELSSLAALLRAMGFSLNVR